MSRINHACCSILLRSRRRCEAGPVTTISFMGAGSAEFTRQLVRDLLVLDDLGPLDLVMHDVDAGRLDLAGGLARLAVERHGGPVSVRTEADRRRALTGADFVINT